MPFQSHRGPFQLQPPSSCPKNCHPSPYPAIFNLYVPGAPPAADFESMEETPPGSSYWHFVQHPLPSPTPSMSSPVRSLLGRAGTGLSGFPPPVPRRHARPAVGLWPWLARIFCCWFCYKVCFKDKCFPKHQGQCSIMRYFAAI